MNRPLQPTIPFENILAIAEDTQWRETFSIEHVVHGLWVIRQDSNREIVACALNKKVAEHKRRKFEKGEY